MPEAMVAHVLPTQRAAHQRNRSMLPWSAPDLPAFISCIACARPAFRRSAARGSRRRRRHLVLEPLSRRALRHPDHRLQLHLRSGTRDAPGPGRRNTPPSRKSCAISASSPTATICGATSASAPRSRRRHGIEATRALAAHDRQRRAASPAAITSWPPAASPRQSRRRSTASRTSRARSISPAAGRMTASISPASASP